MLSQVFVTNLRAVGFAVEMGWLYSHVFSTPTKRI